LEFKIAYANVQGKVGVRNKGGWQEIETMLWKEKWEVLTMTETHWKEGMAKRNILGYVIHHKERKEGSKKGGGIATWIKEDIQHYVREDKTEKQTEMSWIVVETREGKKAIGTVYMGNDTKDNKVSNEKLFQELQEEIDALEKEGIGIIIIGDFNGHIAEGKGKDRNGRWLKEIIIKNNLRLGNDSDKCKG